MATYSPSSASALIHLYVTVAFSGVTFAVSVSPTLATPSTLIALTASGSSGGKYGLSGISTGGAYATSSPAMIAVTSSPRTTSSGCCSITAPEAFTVAVSIVPVPPTVAGASMTRFATETSEPSSKTTSAAVDSTVISSMCPPSTTIFPDSTLILTLAKSPESTTSPSPRISSTIRALIPSPSASCSTIEGTLTYASVT